MEKIIEKIKERLDIRNYDVRKTVISIVIVAVIGLVLSLPGIILQARMNQAQKAYEKVVEESAQEYQEFFDSEEGKTLLEYYGYANDAAEDIGK